ncbi:MAG: hypothetical protein IPK52_21065 [Chloroflexi bacterium]|nr:hypothetical protein [Chloroflexota bacterium]
MRFKQLSVDAEYTLQTIGYTYAAASRVLDADYYPGENTASTPVQTFAYEYDVAGNLTDNNGTARTFNKLNQISSGGVTYDANGNMTNDGTDAYTWDRANRLSSMGGHSYKYNGMSSRVSQAVSSIVIKYLLDMQPALVQVIAATVDGTDTERYIHNLRGIHAAQDAAEDWRYMLQDGLGSVRSEVGDSLDVGASGAYEPYGVPADIDGIYKQPFRFTGEMRDVNTLQYHRVRFYAPSQSILTALDPFDGVISDPISLNGYGWVEGNVTNLIDPSGLCSWSDFDRLKQRSTVFSELAHKWNSISAADCQQIIGATNAPLDDCGVPVQKNLCETGFTDEAFAALLASIVHEEKRLTTGVEGFGFTIYSVIGTLFAEDPSEGIANIRGATVNEILRHEVPVPGIPSPFNFDSSDRMASLEYMYAVFTHPDTRIVNGLGIDVTSSESRDIAFRQLEQVSLELLAVNLYRGMLRVKLLLPLGTATVFNLSTWHNEGVQGSTLDPITSKAKDYGNRVIEHMGEIVNGNCNLNISPVPRAWTDFQYWNIYDLPYIKPEWIWKGGP